MTYKNYKNGKI